MCVCVCVRDQVIGEPLAVLRSLILGQQVCLYTKLPFSLYIIPVLILHLLARIRDPSGARLALFVIRAACARTHTNTSGYDCLVTGREWTVDTTQGSTTKLTLQRREGQELYQYDIKLMRGTAEYFQSLSASRSMEDEIDQLRLQLRQALAHCSQDRDELDRCTDSLEMNASFIPLEK